MTDYDYDLFVVGAGSGGVRAARVAAELGATVAIGETDRMGGTCVNVGCIPKKLFVYGSHFAYDLDDARGYGWSTQPTFDWLTLKENKDREIVRLNGIYENLLARAGVEILRGRVRLLDAHRIEIAGVQRSAERILIATGGKAIVPDIPGREHALTSDAVFSLEALPRQMMVVGAGYVALELGSMCCALGVDVTVVHRGEEILRGFDHDLRCHLHAELEAKGMRILLETQVTELRKKGSAFEAELDSGDVLETDFPLFAVGREPNVEGLGLQELGVELGQRGGIVVDENYSSSVPSIHAVGDVIDHIQLTPVAVAEGMHFAHHFYGEGEHRIDYLSIPTAVFCQPELATVGLTEKEAWHRCQDVRVYKSVFTPLKLALSERKEQTIVKLVVDASDDRVLGCHMAGHGAAEIIQGLAVAIKAGATKAQFDATIGIHPTAAEEFVTLRS
ncbi:MAG: glutathione-disulfide reductase [Deltaproteobacteria bacterium]|nr:glutathione-disulfide reductase [Deltaproteobacteria bacterium]NND27933.1 glutathione-disulfide reductase [Myxococcales bacterium]MBT8463114.1 glutathione-disulfide reductase [Deltaproteobacteria bacterium]MBT8482856.1 glutathione-disulfide reductase [Deltaproteobacteria bacterium]NNK08053.1 glutathione-disulfide reductase [Myxococcales bacterium]